MSFCRRAAIASLLLVVCQPVQAKQAVPDLERQVAYMAQVLEGKLVRHLEIRDYLTPLFQDEDGRDRFLLNFVALVRRGGILDTTVRRVSWQLAEFDDTYGFATGELRACGRWYLWIPRCVEIATQWRRVEGRWYLLPPDKIRLDPEVKKFLRRI